MITSESFPPMSKRASIAVSESQKEIEKIFADKPAKEATDGCDMNWVAENGDHFFVVIRRQKFRTVFNRDA